MPRWTDIVAGLPATVPFVGPETQERALGHAFAARLGANESVFGPSPNAVTAMTEAAAEVWKYGDPEGFELKTALARHHGVAPENIVLGEGIDGLLGLIARLVVAPGVPVVTSAGAYPTFNYQISGAGGIVHTVPYRDDAEDPDALLAKAKAVDAALVYLANPDNPMGSWLDAARIAALIDGLPDGALLCLDEAYCDFAPADAVPPLDMRSERVLRLRTFSKGYGLAGARIGYALGAAPVIAMFDRIRNHFGINRVAQAGALAALADQDYLARTVDKVAAARRELAAIGARHGVRALPSATNFVTFDCGRDGGFARRVVVELARRRVFVRMPFVAPEDRCIRVTAGRPGDLARLDAALPAALAAAGENVAG
ncbi:MAG: pyridoxal phosphate-dependent aminotransferase [Pseudomonadota bacterium]